MDVIFFSELYSIMTKKKRGLFEPFRVGNLKFAEEKEERRKENRKPYRQIIALRSDGQ